MKWATPPTQLARHDEKSNPLSEKIPTNLYNEMSKASHQKVYFYENSNPPFENI